MHGWKRKWLIASYYMVLHVLMKTMGYYYMGYPLWSRDLCLLSSLGSNDFKGDRRKHV
jgi:hypothetical protein